MKAGVKEGDRIIKVSDLPFAHFHFNTSYQLATELGSGTMRVSTVVYGDSG